MSNETIQKCDGCGARTDNRYATGGWIHIDGSLSRSAGEYTSCWRTAYLEKKPTGTDFCSLACLEKKLDDKAPVVAKPCPTCGSKNAVLLPGTPEDGGNGQ